MKKHFFVAPLLLVVGVWFAQRNESDFGSQLNAQLKQCTTEPCAVKVPAGRHPYSTDIVIARPATLDCEAGSVLDYRGTGYAVKMGPDGLTIKDYHYLPYTVRGCTFTGGTKAAQGIYFNRFVTQSFVVDTNFVDFGNCDKGPFAIFYQSQNWWNLVDRVSMWSHSNHCMNGIKINGEDVDGTTDYGQSRTIITNSLLQFDGGTGILVNAFDSKVGPNVTVSGAMKYPIQIGAWGSRSAISHVYQETTGPAKGCIVYGDSTGARTGSFIGGLTVEDSYCNLHNADFKTASRFLAPATPAAGLFHARLYNNTITQSAAGQELVQLNDLASQEGNSADRNEVMVTLAKHLLVREWSGGLHSKGKLIAVWSGSDEASPTHN